MKITKLDLALWIGAAFLNGAAVAADVGAADTLASSIHPPVATPIVEEQQGYDFDENASLGRVLRILASQAGLNYIEPEIDPKETIALRLNGISPRDAFFEVARRRGFSVYDNNGVIELVRDDAPSHGSLVTRRYVLRFIDQRLVLQSVANFLGIEVVQPASQSQAFPAPASTTTTVSSNSSGDSTSSSATSSSSSSNGSTSSSLSGAQSRWTPSLPMDTPLSKGGYEKASVYLDRSDNAIVVRATGRQQEEVARYIAGLDRPEPQVQIYVKVVEIDTDRARELGIDWSFTANNKQFTGGGGVTEGALAGTLKYISPGSTALLSSVEVNAALNALDSKGVATTVSDALVVTRSGVPVFINNSTEERIEIYTNTSGASSATTNMQTGTEPFVTGVIVDVTPRILGDGTIDLNINPTVATKVGETVGASGQKIPKISRRNTTTAVVVRDGMTVGIGGISQDGNTETETSTPILGKIPLIGYAFKHSLREKKRSNVMILVTPSILKTDQFFAAKATPAEREMLMRHDASEARPCTPGAKLRSFLEP